MLSHSIKNIAGWVFTIAAGIVLGLIAARYRVFDSVIVVIALYVVTALLIGIGIKAMTEPWGDLDD